MHEVSYIQSKEIKSENSTMKQKHWKLQRTCNRERVDLRGPFLDNFI